MHEQEDDGLVTDRLSAGGRGFTAGDQVGQCQTTQSQAADLQKIATTVAAISIVDVQHRLILKEVS